MTRTALMLAAFALLLGCVRQAKAGFIVNLDFPQLDGVM
jgi:hypothetical protein